jgi:GT2 family glycosyltransferase
MMIKSLSGCEASIVIVNRNRVELLKNCLESIEKYTQDVRYELIVVDSISTDASRDFLLSSWAHKATLIFEKDNFSYAESSNRAFKWCSGKYIYLLNNDCEVTPGWLRCAIDFADTNYKIGHVASLVLNNDGTVRSHGANLKADGISIIPYSRYKIDNIKLKEVRNYAYAGLGLYRRSVLDAVGYIPLLGNRLYWEATAYGLEVWRAGYTVTYCPSSVVVHIYHPSERNGFNEEIKKGHKAFMDIWGEFLQINDGFSPDYPFKGMVPFKTSDFQYLKGIKQ